MWRADGEIFMEEILKSKIRICFIKAYFIDMTFSISLLRQTSYLQIHKITICVRYFHKEYPLYTYMTLIKLSC